MVQVEKVSGAARLALLDTPIPCVSERGQRIAEFKIPNTNGKYYLDAQRSQVYIRIMPKKRPGDDEPIDISEAYFLPLNPWGAPKLLSVVQFGETDAMLKHRLWYEIEINGHSELVSFEDLRNGECWALWPGLGIHARTQISQYANIIDQQFNIYPDAVKRHKGRRATGWTELDDGRHALILPNGTMWGASGRLDGQKAYLQISAEHKTPYPDELKIDSSKEAQSAALDMVQRIGLHSIAPLSMLTHIRSLMFAILPSDFASILRAQSGSGKTTIASFLRCLTGNFSHYEAATAGMSGTAAAIEVALSQLKHLPAVLDDVVEVAAGSDGEKKSLVSTLDRVLRALGNGTVVRKRMTSKMTEQVSYKVDSCPIITAEERLPQLQQSALNRALIFEWKRGEQDLDLIKWQGPRFAPGLRGVGYGLIQWLAAQWDKKGDALANEWRERHVKATKYLIQRIKKLRPEQDEIDINDRIPSNGAHLMLAAYVLEQYCRDTGVECPITAKSITEDLVTHINKQIDTVDEIMGGADGIPLYAKVLRGMRAALAEHTCYLVTSAGAIPSQADMPAGYLPEDSGAQRLGEFFGAPGRAACIGVIDAAQGMVYLREEHAYRVLQRYIDTNISEDAVWKSLDKKKLIRRQNERQRTKSTSANLPECTSHRPRLVHMPITTLFPRFENGVDDAFDDIEMPFENDDAPTITITPAAPLTPVVFNTPIDNSGGLMNETVPVTSPPAHFAPTQLIADPEEEEVHTGPDEVTKPIPRPTPKQLSDLARSYSATQQWETDDVKRAAHYYELAGSPPMQFHDLPTLPELDNLREQTFQGVALFEHLATIFDLHKMEATFYHHDFMLKLSQLPMKEAAL